MGHIQLSEITSFFFFFFFFNEGLSTCHKYSSYKFVSPQTEPDARKSLYKLRTTWPPYLPNRKLAAIDRHVHALDPNWPVSATDGSISPAIFVNPMFVGVSTCVPRPCIVHDITHHFRNPLILKGPHLQLLELL